MQVWSNSESRLHLAWVLIEASKVRGYVSSDKKENEIREPRKIRFIYLIHGNQVLLSVTGAVLCYTCLFLLLYFHLLNRYYFSSFKWNNNYGNGDSLLNNKHQILYIIQNTEYNSPNKCLRCAS